MSSSMILVFALCMAACAHALYWSLVLIRVSDRLSNLMLSGLLVSLALRVGKSVTIFVIPEAMIPANVVGLLGMSWAGPFTLLFALALFDSSFRFRRIHLLHFVPGVIALGFAIMGHWIVYRIFTVHLFIYLIATAVWLIRNRSSHRSDDDAWRWVWYVTAGTFILCITFGLQLTFYQPLIYRLIVLSATVIFYGLSWWAIGHARLFTPPRKQKAVVDLYRDVGIRIEQLLTQERIFVDPTLNVSGLAQLLKVPPYVVSRAVNSTFNKTFSELLTSHRLRHAEARLISDSDKYTVEGIAFESGFNTVSSFYTAFRKQHNMTPMQYRNSGRLLDDRQA
ncbi:helix-turn-helix domain-containing protein [Chryseolinea sp. T2]|uniref:AraC family transcriptional regulator n=1 Tax=Chryseolinea sp. T2 TaxID=3129255 RepID=UPI003077689A